MAVWDKVRQLLPFGKPLIRREPVSYRAIGVVRNRIREHGRQGWQHVRSDIFLLEDLEPALQGLEGFSHVIVIFHMNGIADDQRWPLRFPAEDEIRPEIGVLATRLPVRPNAIGLSVVPVLWRRKNVLRVSGLDALDGSPVLDIKPYLPSYDAVAGATLPHWAGEAIRR